MLKINNKLIIKPKQMADNIKVYDCMDEAIQSVRNYEEKTDSRFVTVKTRTITIGVEKSGSLTTA